jgi:hypothetical protein
VGAGDSGQAGGAVAHQDDGVVENLGHGVEVVSGETGEQRSTWSEFHAAFRVDSPDLDHAGGDGGAQAPQQRPQHRALA